MEKEEKVELLIELRKEEGLNRKEFAKKYEIPYPTITDWEMGNRRIPEYLLRLLEYKIRSEKASSTKRDAINYFVEVPSRCRCQKIKVSEIDKNNISNEIVDRVLFEGMEDTGEQAECIIVLGSSKASKYRVPVAVEDYKKGRAHKILLSGGSIREFSEGRMSEAEHMRQTAFSMGVSPEDIILETRSTNTVENMLCSLMELQSTFWLNNVKRVLLVTTTYHMRRSLAIARYLFPKHIEIIPCPADDNNTRRDNWMNSDEGRNRAIAEVMNIITCVENGVFPDFEI